MRDGNGGAELGQSRWWAGDVHEMSGLRDFLFLERVSDAALGVQSLVLASSVQLCGGLKGLALL